jgi:hypothetical protein
MLKSFFLGAFISSLRSKRVRTSLEIKDKVIDL